MPTASQVILVMLTLISGCRARQTNDYQAPGKTTENFASSDSQLPGPTTDQNQQLEKDEVDPAESTAPASTAPQIELLENEGAAQSAPTPDYQIRSGNRAHFSRFAVDCDVQAGIASVFIHNLSSSTFSTGTGYVYIRFYDISSNQISDTNTLVSTRATIFSSSREKILSISAPSRAMDCNADVSELLSPAMPKLLQVTGYTETTISLAWQAGSSSAVPTVRYIVRYIEGGVHQVQNCENGLSLDVGNQKVATLTDLKKGTRYSIYVCAVGDYGESTPSGYVDATTVADPSPEVVDIQFSSRAIDRITATWKSGGGSTYSYAVTVVPEGQTPPACNTDGAFRTDTSTLSVGGLQSEQTYAFRICSVNINGLKSPGVIATAKPRSPSDTSLPFTDTFSRSELGVSWSGDTSAFGITNRSLSTEGSTRTILTLAGEPAVNVTQVFTISIAGKNGGTVNSKLGLLARYDAATQNGYIGRVNKKSKNGFKLEIVRLKNGQETILASTGCPKRASEKLTFTVASARLTLKFGQKTISVFDSQISSSGNFGIISYGPGQSLDIYGAQ